jgi:hypothetical protein
MSRKRRGAIATTLCAVFMLLLAGTAAARPPDLVSVGAIDRQVTAKWTLENGMSSGFVQIAKAPDVTEFGYFLQRNLVSFSVLSSSQTTFRDTLALNPGTYYVHIGGSDDCYPDCPRVEFSEIWEIEVGASGTAIGTDLSKTGKKPSQFVTYRRTQSVKKLRLRARMDINGSLVAKGTLTVKSRGGKSRSYALGPITKLVAADKSTSFVFKLSKQASRAALRSIAAGKRPKAVITITARDGLGRTADRPVSVKL